jgi:hypothetical protein
LGWCAVALLQVDDGCDQRETAADATNGVSTVRPWRERRDQFLQGKVGVGFTPHGFNFEFHEYGKCLMVGDSNVTARSQSWASDQAHHAVAVDLRPNIAIAGKMTNTTRSVINAPMHTNIPSR